MKSNESNIRNVLFVSVHPDDETLGCGGTILKHKVMGDKVFWLNITGPTPNHPMGFSAEVIGTRNKLVERISTEYGFEKSFNLDLPTMLLDTYPLYELVGMIERIFSGIKPGILYIPNRSDVHSDHKVAFTAVYSCTKNFRKPYIKKILMYETLSETEFAPALSESQFIPNTFMDVTDFMAEKIRIMRLYDTEIMADPMPRSPHAIMGLAAIRGSRIGVKYAEAFQLLFSTTI